VGWKDKEDQSFIPSPDVPEALVELEAAIVKNAYRARARLTINA
jgi:hypothetical protein